MDTELKSYTIVPDSLYVERKADQQLHSIVESMQRPGYVLVSRQMGKTNLLLRAKRKWENSNDLYVYVDMSNIADTERDCFETLIDTAIDTHEDILLSIREKIKDLRLVNITKSPVQAHNEELRALLTAVKGKLVFILDEIDSLTRTSYSDNVFSQIRSVYFSRVNYPVLEKLTYVLSGVVEPTEIIKNPKISPFNIGEKILLDDFTREEYTTFIEKAGLSDFGKDVIDRIYYWAGGNPRMTWDICYALQSKEDKKNKEIVDSLVKEMYLTSFDIAPVDTIRSLVKEDRDLRDAIIQLAYDKGSALSDKTKGKLYLSGIVNYNDSEVKIKNLIIKESLSLNWLRKVEEEEKGQIPYAMELHAKGYYRESLDKFENYLKSNEFPENNAPYCYYCMGSCCHHLQDFERSLSYLTTKPLDKATTPFEFRHAQFMAGANCLKLGIFDKSLDYFQKAMAGDTRDWVYYSAWLNSLTARQSLAKDDEEIKEIEKDYVELLALPNESSNIDTKIYAALGLGELVKFSNPQKANEVYDKALEYASDTARIRILLEKYEVANDGDRQATLEVLVQVLNKIDEVSESLDPDNNLGLNEDVFTRALLLIYIYDYEKWPLIREKLSLLPYSYGDSLYKVFLQVFTSSAYIEDGAPRLIKELHDNITSERYNFTSVQKYHIFKYNAFFNFDLKFSNEYLDAFKLTADNIDSIGLVVVRSHALQLLGSRQARTIIQNLEWITERYPVNMSHTDMANRALVDYTLLISYYSINDISSVQGLSRMILAYIDDEILASNGNTRENLLYIKKITINAITSTSPQEPIRQPNIYRRNDRVRVKYLHSNQIVEKKYKYVEADLKKGACVLVDV